MKNLILTFALVLSSFMSFGQNERYFYFYKNSSQLTWGETGQNSGGIRDCGEISGPFEDNDIIYVQFRNGNGDTLNQSKKINFGDLQSVNNIDFIINIYVDTTSVTEVPVKLKFTITNTLSVSTIEVNDLKLFPNPVNDVLNVSFNSHENVPVSVMNLNGQVVFETNSSMSTQIDVSNFQKGMYFLCIGNTRKKFVKE